MFFAMNSGYQERTTVVRERKRTDRNLYQERKKNKKEAREKERKKERKKERSIYS